MEKRFYTVLDRQGRPVSGAAVEVRTWPFGELATIYSDDGVTVKANPTLTDENGYFEYYAPNGHYTWIITTNLETRIVNDVSHDDSLRDWLTTGGTGTAYTLTPPYPLLAYVSGVSYLVQFHTACGASPTLQISGLANPPNLVKRNPDGTLANLAANDVPANWRSRVTLVSATQALVEDMP
jgi:hypothetical protein